MADEIETTETDDTQTGEGTDEELTGDTFPREYVTKLRNESKSHRDRAKAAEERADTAEKNLDAALRQLWTFKVTSTGKLADPTDLPFDPGLLADDEKLNAAIDDLVSRKPHLKARKVSGPVGQGITGDKAERFNLIDAMRRTL